MLLISQTLKFLDEIRRDVLNERSEEIMKLLIKVCNHWSFFSDS